MHIWKDAKKFGQGLPPPPLFGQNSKEQQFSSGHLPKEWNNQFWENCVARIKRRNHSVCSIRTLHLICPNCFVTGGDSRVCICYNMECSFQLIFVQNSKCKLFFQNGRCQWKMQKSKCKKNKIQNTKFKMQNAMPNSEYKMQDSKCKMFKMECSLQLLPVQRVASLTRWEVRRSSCSSLRNCLGSQPDCGQHRHQEASLRKAISICPQAFSCRPKEASFWKLSKWSWLKFREGVGRKRTL